MFSGNQNKIYTKLPFGFRDIFPVEARERKLIKDAVREEFELWGYGEVKTPAIEYTSNIAQGAGKEWKDRLLSFFDRDSNLVSLRADMTIPIARLTGMRLKKEQMPARFYYFANSFRQSEVQKGLKRVINQAGLELIGSSSFVSDIEVINILTDILKKLGLKEFKIGIGHVGILQGLYQWLGLETEQVQEANKNLISGDLVGLRSVIKSEEKYTLFLDIIKPSTDMNSIKRYSSKIKDKKLKESIGYLEKIFSIMAKLGKDKNLLIDIGKTKEFEYYSGLFFEIFSPRTDEVLGSGGRYDGLIKKFGLDVPATGFALDIDVLHDAIESGYYSGKDAENRSLVVGEVDDCEKVFLIVQKLQQRGTRVETYFGKIPNKEEFAIKRRCRYLYLLDSPSGNIQVTDLKKGNHEIHSLKDFLNW